MRKLKLEELNRLSIEDFKKAEKQPIVVVLDNIRSMNNVGSVFRTSDGFLVEKILLCGYCPRPPHREIRKTAIGAEESMEWVYFEKVSDALESLKNDGYYIIGIEQTDSSSPLNEFDRSPHAKLAIVMGNEVEGVSPEALDYCEEVLEIPQFGTKHSFNVSVTTGMVLYHMVLGNPKN